MSGAGFVNLHNHSHYSILDGYSKPVEYLKQAAALGQTALALTDHGNLFGAFEFVSAARAMSKSLDKKKHPQEPVWVKPIVGIEAYMAPENPEGAKCKKPVFYSDDPSKRSIDVSSNGAYTHLTLLAVDDAGFHNLIRLSTESFKRENTYYNQRMDMSMLAKWNTGLVATTGCPSGEIQTRLRLGQVKEAYEYAERMSDLFPGRYYVEIMSHAMKKDLERDAIPQLLKLAEDLKLPLLATNDAHYANPGDARRHEEMLCINTNSRGGAGERVYMDTPTEDTVDEWMETHQKEAQDYLSRGRKVPTRFAFSGNDYYLKSYEEMIRQFPEDKFPGAVRNTLEVADMVGDWWAKKPLDLEAIADKYRDDVELAKAGKAFDADYRLPHAGGGTSLVGPVKANKGVTVLGETPSRPAEFKSDPLTQKLIDDGTVALGPYDLSLNKGIRPVIQIPEGWTEAQWFQKKLNDGFVQRRVAKGDSPEILAESKRRLDVEYPVFEGNDFVQYMLVVADYIGWAREHGVTVGSGRGCFLPGTRVKGKQGAMRRIEDYVPGDVVQTHDTSYHKVEKVFEYDVKDEDCVEVRLMDGATIRCTADHMLFAKNKGFTQAQELESGTVLLGPVCRKEQFTIECMNKGCHNKIALCKQDYDVRLNKEYASKKGEVWCWDCVKHNVHNVPAVQAGSIKGALRNKDADVKAKNAASIHAHWNDPVARAAHLAKIENWKNSEKFQEFRRHCSERNKRRYSDAAELDKLIRQGHGNYESGWFTSYQQDELRIYYASSYELKALNILETDSTVASFDRFNGRISYVSPSDGREHWYLPDFRVDYADGRKVVIEVKAKWQEKEPNTQAKLQAGEKWCQDNGFDFEVWDEDVLASKNDAWHREYVVESVAHFRYTGKVYDLQVGGVHNYNVQGVTAHNSVGGSEVAYLMDISRTDPIRHDLLFERFLNPERKSPPDVDTDFKASVRNDVLQYAKDKYGYDNVANIVNFGTFKLKQAFQDIAKIYHADSAQAIKMSKMIPDPIDHGEPTMEDLYDPASPFYPLAGDFREAIEAGGEQWKPIREAAGALVGRVRQTGTHACGVIMCSEPIVNYAPLFWNKNEERAKENIWTDCMCQWKYQDLEAIGLIKMDFLPLSTLDIVDSVIDNVEQYNEQIDVAASAASRAGDADRAAAYRKRKLEVPDFTDIENDGMEDPETFEMLASGESDAVFQMGSDGQKDLLKRLRPTEFDDLVAINALYRPGPMAMNAHLQYADRKNGKEPCYIVDEELDKAFKGTPVEDVLKLTYGLILFQESVQQIAQRLSGYTRGQSDSLRKAMGHKIPEEMEANHKMFVDGAMKTARGNSYKYTEEDVEKLWKIIEQFSAYAFNKSHSVSYAINAYETAYLKCHYKPFFWAANLTQNMKNKDKFRKFLRSARDMGLQVESVDVNKSGVGVTAAFDPGKDATDTITFGFDTASVVNETVAREIVAARNKNGGSFKSFDDFMTHGPESILSAGAITGLADAGAFDCLGVKRKQVADRARWSVDFYKKKRTAVASSSKGLLGMLGGRGAKSTEKSMGEYDLTRDEYSKKEGTISFGPLSYDWATMLAKEKASLGVYASADPLSNAGYGLEVMKKNPSSPYRAISTLEEEARTAQGDSGSSGSSNGGSRRRKAATVRLIGYLVDLAVKRNAKGSVWFSGSVCDESGSIEFRMYSRAIQQRMEETGIGDPKTVISEDTVYDMMCSWSADTGRLTIDAVSEVPIAKADGAVPIIIRMKGEGSLRSAKWRDVAALLSAHPGNVPVAVDLAQASGKVELDGRPARRGVNMLGARVDGSREFMDGLTALVGDRLCSWSSKGRWDPEY